MVGYFWWFAASWSGLASPASIRSILPWCRNSYQPPELLNPRSDHHDAARGIYSGGGTRTVPRSLCRLARPVRDRAAAGGYEPPDPRLGSESAHWLIRVG